MLKRKGNSVERSWILRTAVVTGLCLQFDENIAMFGSCTSDTRNNIAKMKEGGCNSKTASLKFTVRDHSHVGEETETSVRQSSKVKRL